MGTIEWYTGAAKAKAEVVEMGGPGSGHWRHAGRKGKRGGSAPSKARGRAALPSARLGLFGNRLQVYGPEKRSAMATWHDDTKQYEVAYYEGTSLEGEAYFTNAKDARDWVEKRVEARLDPSTPGGALVGQAVVTGNDPKKIVSAIENHAESAQFPVKVETVRVLNEVPEGYTEFWHGTSRGAASAIAESNELRMSEIGAFGEGVYLAPGANKSIAYASEKYGKDDGAMLRVAADTGKILELTPQNQAKIKQFTTDPKVVRKYRDRLNSARQMETDLKARNMSKDDRRLLIQHKYPEVEFESTPGGGLYPTWGAGERVYAKAHGFDSIQYIPPKSSNPIAALRQAGRDKIGFSNEEISILDPTRVIPIAVAEVRHVK